MDEVKAALAQVEADMGKKFADPDNTLLLSVRSGAAVSRGRGWKGGWEGVITRARAVLGARRPRRSFPWAPDLRGLTHWPPYTALHCRFPSPPWPFSHPSCPCPG